MLSGPTKKQATGPWSRRLGARIVGGVANNAPSCARIRRGVLGGSLLCTLLMFGRPVLGAASTGPRDGLHDFDFEIGSWHTHLARLAHPLSGSHTWVEYDGTTEVRKVWGGRANLVELEVDGPAGHIEALSLRLYNPQSHQWSLNFASSRGGALGVPTVGGFQDGRGEFYDQEQFGERTVLVRFVIAVVSADSCHFEQAFSTDGGRSWEVNWIATDTRVAGTAAR